MIPKEGCRWSGECCTERIWTESADRNLHRSFDRVTEKNVDSHNREVSFRNQAIRRECWLLVGCVSAACRG